MQTAIQKQSERVSRLGKLFDRTYTGNNWDRHVKIANEYLKQSMILKDMQYEAWLSKNND